MSRFADNDLMLRFPSFKLERRLSHVSPRSLPKLPLRAVSASSLPKLPFRAVSVSCLPKLPLQAVSQSSLSEQSLQATLRYTNLQRPLTSCRFMMQFHKSLAPFLLPLLGSRPGRTFLYDISFIGTICFFTPVTSLIVFAFMVRISLCLSRLSFRC